MAGRPLVSALTSPVPNILWVELTSRCPFDCVFCSRKTERGIGEHLDFTLFRSLISQLDRPHLIRLNYSGESTHYPHLLEAIRLARSTGAVTELVSAFSSVSRSVLCGLVDEELSRLTISLHTMDAGQYQDIYRFGSLDETIDKLNELQRYKSEKHAKFPEVDFAFVAMAANLHQLQAVADFASTAGIPHISVHPVIRRSPIPYDLNAELQPSGALRVDFQDRLERELRTVGSLYPHVAITIDRPQFLQAGATCEAMPFEGLTTCEQNPWETVHVLSGGEVVVCEVQDRTSLGNLRDQTLREIWLGERYQRFREEYLAGRISSCRTCAWRRTVPWDQVRQAVTSDEGQGSPELVRGWHPVTNETVAWSRGNAVLVLKNPAAGKTELRISGVLPPGPDGGRNELRIRIDGNPAGAVANETGEAKECNLAVAVARQAGRVLAVEFDTAFLYCPSREDASHDVRQLGFGLTEAGIFTNRPRLLQYVFFALAEIDKWCARSTSLAPMFSLRADRRWDEPGVSIIIPERSNPDRLHRCLMSVRRAGPLSEPTQVLVVVNGSSRSHYTEMIRRFPEVEFTFCDRPLSFARAIKRGLRESRHQWVYLLNNDMVLHEDALSRVMCLRAKDVFSIGSQIEMEDESRRGEETNWTAYRYRDGVVDLIERDPANLTQARDSLYGGGGSTLFQRRLLNRLIARTFAYDPFYWEDVDWGATAWRHGYRNLFCPESRVRHGHRCTISKFYEPPEVQRVFDRNRYLFQLRHLGDEVPAPVLQPYLERLDEVSWRELFGRAGLISLFCARIINSLSPFGEDRLREMRLT